MAKRQKKPVIIEEPIYGGVPEEKDPADEKKYTQEQAAQRAGCHRVTLLRMEQRKALPPPTWKRYPIAHRVYSDNDVAAIKKIMDEKAEKPGRVFIDEGKTL